ncbi:MAG: tetratricopeptide repeat protein [Myxococcota bacterium]
MEPAQTTYGVREAAQILGVPPTRVRSLAKAGGVEPTRGPRGEWRFAFRDLHFLRRLRDLSAGRIHPRRVRRALSRLRASLPPNSDLRELGLANAQGELVVREDAGLWSPEDGQWVFDFESWRPSTVIDLRERAASRREPTLAPGETEADRWYRLGCELEEVDPLRARAAYTRAVDENDELADAHVNLGRLEHEAGELASAEQRYRRALALEPSDVTARFNLAVVLEDLSRDDEAVDAYRTCLKDDPACAEAHFNLARLCEQRGDEEASVRHLVAYWRLVKH